MFFRVLLLSYFVLGAAWGPAFCCCRVRSLVEYCTQSVSATEAVASTRSAETAGSCPRCRAAAEQKRRELAGRSPCCSDSTQQRAPDSECPCQQRGEAEFWLVGVELPGFVDACSGSQCPINLLSDSLSWGFASIPTFSSRSNSWDQHPRVGALFGCALLCAYQTFNC
jgi:hypothetical protein